jgi:hypothetical protein
MDGRADCAIIVGVARRKLRRPLLGRRRFRGRDGGKGGAAPKLLEMDVSERKDKLQRHRRKREVSAPPPIDANPTHWQNCVCSRTTYFTAEPTPEQTRALPKNLLVSKNNVVVARM